MRRSMIEAEREAGRLLRRYVTPKRRPGISERDAADLVGLPQEHAQARRAELEGARLLLDATDADELIRACAHGENERASAIARRLAAELNTELSNA